ncbi:MAG: hypothetical protein IBJ10_10440 [Phycisphaerales bacterium]|nr:hypothetical protein [Phycisphaerales bacterium]
MEPNAAKIDPESGAPGVVYAGLDEAGYGPMLGPLCVAVSVFRVRGWAAGAPAPDLWKSLRAAVCRAGEKAAARRVAIDDSKRLKGPATENDPHGVARLERAALAMLMLCGRQFASDADVLGAFGADPEPHPWSSAPPRPAPLANDAARLRIDANHLGSAMAGAGVEPLDLRVCAVGVDEFNQSCARLGSKGAVNFEAAAGHMRYVWERWGTDGAALGGPRLVCDRHGGRTCYAGELARAFPGVRIEILEESPRASRYLLSDDGGDRRMTVLFRPEAEQAHLPVALASMAAKYVRELSMIRFNDHWCARAPGLAPTAGYVADARRWLQDAAEFISPQERRALVRLR